MKTVQLARLRALVGHAQHHARVREALHADADRAVLEVRGARLLHRVVAAVLKNHEFSSKIMGTKHNILSKSNANNGFYRKRRFNLLLRGIGMLDLSEMPANPNPDSIFIEKS